MEQDYRYWLALVALCAAVGFTASRVWDMHYQPNRTDNTVHVEIGGTLNEREVK